MRSLQALLIVLLTVGAASAAPKFYTRTVTIAVEASDRVGLEDMTSLAVLLENGFSGIRLQVRPASSAGEALRMVVTGRADLAIADEAVIAEFQLNERRLARNVSVVAALSVCVGIFIVPQSSAAQSVFDLVGGRVAWRVDDTKTTTVGRMTVDGLGLSLVRHFEPVAAASLAESLEAMQSQKIDAVWLVAPVADLRAALGRASGRAIGFSARHIERVLQRHPQLRAHDIPLGDSEDGLIRSVATASLLVARSELPEELVYRVASVLTGPSVDAQASLRLSAFSTAGIVGGRHRIHAGATRRFEELRAN